MTPNIDAKGRMVRRSGGIAVLLAAGLLAWRMPRPWPGWIWILLGVLTAAGLFMLYEARRSWCALRACGIKTPY